MAEARRQAAEARGRKSERLAALSLQLKGYAVLARRVKTPVGEIDLIVRRGRVIAFVEVKARAHTDAALNAVSQTNWQRIARAADFWMARQPRLSDLGWRYDLVAVTPGRWPVQVRDAWRPGMS